LWEELVVQYDAGVEGADRLASDWATLEDKIDPQRFRAVSENLAIQQSEARWWRDASIAYWQSLNNLPLPAGARLPAESLVSYQKRAFPEAPGQ
jgi:alpha-glucuronidase